MERKSIEEINVYVERAKENVNQKWMPLYHLAPPTGWLNDPNGFVYFKGRYHLFGQYYPYSSQWGLMHWGHWTSEDLIHWQWKGIALAPDTLADEGGCFSGTAWAAQDVLYIMYTGLGADGRGGFYQQQCVAVSRDGETFEKLADNPVIGREQLPAEVSPYDFRDPKLIVHGEGFRAIVAGCAGGQGKLLCFESEDLVHWRYEGVFWEGLPQMLECPDYFELGGKPTLMVSVIGKPVEEKQYSHDRPSILLCGEEEGAKRFSFGGMQALDYGEDFYAAQTALAPDGRRLMIGWLQNWAHEGMPTHYLGHGWNGCLSLIRELSWKDGKLMQRPLAELERLRAKRREIDREISDARAVRLSVRETAEILLELTEISARAVTLALFEEKAGRLLVCFESAKNLLSVDASACGYEISGKGDQGAENRTQAKVMARQGKLSLRIFVDRCSVEIFVNGGEKVISMRVFPRESGCRVCLGATEGKAHGRLVAYDLEL